MQGGSTSSLRMDWEISSAWAWGMISGSWKLVPGSSENSVARGVAIPDTCRVVALELLPDCPDRIWAAKFSVGLRKIFMACPMKSMESAVLGEM